MTRAPADERGTPYIVAYSADNAEHEVLVFAATAVQARLLVLGRNHPGKRHEHTRRATEEEVERG